MHPGFVSGRRGLLQASGVLLELLCAYSQLRLGGSAPICSIHEEYACAQKTPSHSRAACSTCAQRMRARHRYQAQAMCACILHALASGNLSAAKAGLEIVALSGRWSSPYVLPRTCNSQRSECSVAIGGSNITSTSREGYVPIVNVMTTRISMEHLLVSGMRAITDAVLQPEQQLESAVSLRASST